MLKSRYDQSTHKDGYELTQEACLELSLTTLPLAVYNVDSLHPS